MTRIAPGRYYLSAGPMNMTAAAARRAGGNTPAPEGNVTTWYPGVLSLSEASLIDVAVGQDVTGLNLKLRKAPVYTVRGRVGGSLLPGSGQPGRLILTVTGGMNSFPLKNTVPSRMVRLNWRVSHLAGSDLPPKNGWAAENPRYPPNAIRISR